MSKSTRLVQLLQEIRLHDPPVTATVLAQAMGVSERTIYRDIESLRESGAVIDGTAGYGYSLTEDSAMPAMMFSHDEIEALVLGLKEVQAIADPALALAAKHALSKLHAGLPPRLKNHLKHAVLHAVRFRARPEIHIDPALVRQAAWQEMALDIAYKDASGVETQRRIYPLSIAYLEDVLVVVSFCCLRQDSRAFRMDRIMSVTPTDESYRPNRVRMLAAALRKIRAGEGDT